MKTNDDPNEIILFYKERAHTLGFVFDFLLHLLEHDALLIGIARCVDERSMHKLNISVFCISFGNMLTY